MSWKFYCLRMKLKSPLHIGTYKISHFNPTRLYVPGKVVWAALTATITRYIDSSDYKGVGNFLNTHLKFGYYFPTLLYKNGSEEIFHPNYTSNGLIYGNISKLSEAEFKSMFLSSQASTAIDPHSKTAKDEMLHEIEFINHHTISSDKEDSQQVFLNGVLWVKEGRENSYQIKVIDKSIHFIYNNSNDIDIHKSLNKILQIGGERNYGFGAIELKKLDDNVDQFHFTWKEKSKQIFLSLKKNGSILAHVGYDDKLEIKGNIEPLVSRVWSDNGAGKKLENKEYHWVPGSKILKNYQFKICKDGIWKLYFL
ncbi:MAG: hypothetical protein P8Y97_21965 [Candidatus Lokiarchaeota archaeon]